MTIGSLLLVASLNFSNLSSPVDVPGIVEAATPSSSMEIAEDPNFSKKTLNFVPNQTIFVRVTAEKDGQGRHNLNLRDNGYSLLKTYLMTSSGGQFTVNFPAPEDAGTYSLEADIASGGSVANLVQTITVGGAPGGDLGANVRLENKINSESDFKDDPVSAAPSPAVDQPQAGDEKNQGFFFLVWSKIVSLFGSIF